MSHHSRSDPQTECCHGLVRTPEITRISFRLERLFVVFHRARSDAGHLFLGGGVAVLHGGVICRH